MRIFDDVFQKNKKAAYKNRDKPNVFLPVVQNKSKQIEKNTETSIDQSQDYFSSLNVNQNSIYEIIDAEIVSEIFERDSRRYSSGFEIDTGGIKI